MNFIKNNLLACIGLTIILSSLYTFMNHHQSLDQSTSTVPSDQNNQCIQSYVKELELEEKTLWDELGKLHITKENCLEQKMLFEEEYKQIKGPTPEELQSRDVISSKTNQLIETVFNNFHIDTNAITIIPYKDPGNSTAAANDLCLFIDEDSLEQYSEKAQKFILGHESQHIIFKDDSLRFILDILIPIEKRTEKEIDLLNKLYRFQEKRADICTILKGRDYADGSLEFIDALVLKYGDTPGITHPKISDRLQLATNVLKRFKDQNVIA